MSHRPTGRRLCGSCGSPVYSSNAADPGRYRLRLGLLDPKLVLERGYAWLTDTEGHAVTRAASTRTGQALTATLADGEVDLTVAPRRLI